MRTTSAEHITALPRTARFWSAYGWSRLSSVEGGVAAGGVSLSYDPLGRLYQVASPSGTRRFAYDGQAIIGEYDALGTSLHRYLHGAGVDELVAWDDRTDPAGPERFYAHADERGSVIGYSDYADRMVRLNRYDEYGRPQAGALNGGFGFTGQMWLPEIGMYSYRARIYNPALGRFMQADPIGYDGGMSLYAYVGNDPVNFTDPLGLDKGGKEDFKGKIKWVDKGWGKSFGNPGFGFQKEVRNVTISKDSRTGLSTKTIGPWTPVTDSPTSVGFGFSSSGTDGPDPGKRDASASDLGCDPADVEHCAVVTGTRSPSWDSQTGQLFLAQSDIRYNGCITAGHMCLEIFPFNDYNRRQCQALQRSCDVVRRGGANDRDPRYRGTELCVSSSDGMLTMCVTVYPGGIVTAPRITRRY